MDIIVCVLSKETWKVSDVERCLIEFNNNKNDKIGCRAGHFGLQNQNESKIFWSVKSDQKITKFY